MITVIDENKYEGQYDSMTLAEAGEQLIVDITESANEFQMGVLLFEHSYLYETGNEIDYLNEAEGRENIISRFVDWVKNKAWPAIRDFFKRAEDAIYEFFASTIPGMFSKMGLNKKKFDEVIKKWGSTRVQCESVKSFVRYDALKNASKMMTKADSSKFGVSFKASNNAKSGKESYSAVYSDKRYTKDEFKRKEHNKSYNEETDKIRKSVVTDMPTGIVVTAATLQMASDTIFNKNTILKDISKAKNEANRDLQQYIKMARSVKNDDDISRVVSEYTRQIKQNTQIYRGIVKYYTLHVSNCAKIIRFATNMVNGKNFKAGEAEKIRELDRTGGGDSNVTYNGRPNAPKLGYSSPDLNTPESLKRGKSSGSKIDNLGSGKKATKTGTDDTDIEDSAYYGESAIPSYDDYEAFAEAFFAD